MTTQPEGLTSRLLADDLAGPSFASRPPVISEPENVEQVAEAALGMEPDQVSLEAELPANVALLCVSRASFEGLPSFKLHFHYRSQVRAAALSQDLEEQRPPELVLAKIAEETNSGDSPWRDAYYDMMSWWAPKRKLVQWIRVLLSTAEEPRLIVWDNTDYEIPWELFYQKIQGAEGRWLGELIPVIRWITVHDGGKPWHYDAQEHRCVGGLLMLEEPEMAVRPDGFKRYEIEQRVQTMYELARRLDVPTHPFGLLVIRCHGVYSKDIRRYTLAGLSLNEYTEFPMQALSEAGALVFINACVAARPVIDVRHPGAASRSFAEIFLRHGAAGVIATVGNIDLQHSHDFAVRLLESSETEDLNVPEAIRSHRAYYAGKVRRPTGGLDKRTESDFKRFFSSFMYVYFGHPKTALRTVLMHEEGSQ